MIAFLTIFFLAGCENRSKSRQLLKEINTYENQKATYISDIEEVKDKISERESDLRSLQDQKIEIKTELEVINEKHPILTACIISDGALTGMAMLFASDDQNTKATGMVVGATCLLASQNDDYAYYKDKIIDLNHHVEKLSTKMQAAQADMRSYDSQKKELEEKISSFESSIIQLQDQLACEESIGCNISRMLDQI
jgi:peptidoglycan hydrolase CwlO-like protein